MEQIFFLGPNFKCQTFHFDVGMLDAMLLAAGLQPIFSIVTMSSSLKSVEVAAPPPPVSSLGATRA